LRHYDTVMTFIQVYSNECQYRSNIIVAIIEEGEGVLVFVLLLHWRTLLLFI